MIKYIVHPGYVRSRVDNEQHWISARQLMNLYGVSPKECVIGPLSSPIRIHGLTRNAIAKLIHLVPRYDGKYKNYGYLHTVPS